VWNRRVLPTAFLGRVGEPPALGRSDQGDTLEAKGRRLQRGVSRTPCASEIMLGLGPLQNVYFLVFMIILVAILFLIARGRRVRPNVARIPTASSSTLSTVQNGPLRGTLVLSFAPESPAAGRSCGCA